MTLKRSIYKVLAVSNDVSAIRRHRVGKRLVNRFIGRNIVRRMWWK